MENRLKIKKNNTNYLILQDGKIINIDGKDSNITLQKLVNRSMYLFATDQGFKDKIQGTEILSEDYKTGY